MQDGLQKHQPCSSSSFGSVRLGLHSVICSKDLGKGNHGNSRVGTGCRNFMSKPDFALASLFCKPLPKALTEITKSYCTSSLCFFSFSSRSDEKRRSAPTMEYRLESKLWESASSEFSETNSYKKETC